MNIGARTGFTDESCQNLSISSRVRYLGAIISHSSAFGAWDAGGLDEFTLDFVSILLCFVDNSLYVQHSEKWALSRFNMFQGLYVCYTVYIHQMHPILVPSNICQGIWIYYRYKLFTIYHIDSSVYTGNTVARPKTQRPHSPVYGVYGIHYMYVYMVV